MKRPEYVMLPLLNGQASNACSGRTVVRGQTYKVTARLWYLPLNLCRVDRQHWAPKRLSPSKIRCRKAGSGISLPGSGQSSL